ncbi:DUF58 domain-containing protein [Cyclobacteriaceae bacterium]|nr:DUF58 domain-containing protein [Cyclobacteriaceae bacterium]
MHLDFETINQYGGIDFFAKKSVEGFIIGLHKSPYQGFSVEFSEHKAYTPGESTKNIDWKLFSKTDRLYKKVYDEETNLRAYILLDTSSSMNYPDGQKNNKSTYAKYCAAALISLFQSQRDAVSLVTFDSKINQMSPAKTSALHCNNLYNQLKELPTSTLSTSNISDSLHELANRIPKRSLVIVLSDLIYQNETNEEFFKSLMHLKFNNHETMIFQLIDKKTEFNFEFNQKPMRFIDLETNEKITFKPNEINEQLVKKLKDRVQEFATQCKKYKTELLEIDINQPIDQVLTPYLINRAKKG